MRYRTAAATALAVLAAAPAAGATEVGHSGWSWGSPRAQGSELRAIAFAEVPTKSATGGGPAGRDPGRGYAVGAWGTALRTDDGGASWSAIPTGRTSDLSLLAVLGPDAFVAGGGCVLRRSDDAGRTLRRMPFAASESSCPAPLAALAFGSPQVGTLLLNDGTVLRTDDGGATFSRRTALPGTRAAGGNLAPRDVVMAGASEALALAATGNESQIHRSTDGGATWTQVAVAGGGLRSLHLAPGGTAYAAGDVLLRSPDAGATWESRGAHGATQIRCGGPDSCLMVAGRGSSLLRTTDGGETATVIAPADHPLRAVAWIDGERAIAVGERGTTVISSDGGRSFSRAGGELPGRYTRMRAAGGDLAVAVGLSGALARTTDGGATWVAGAVSTSEDVIDASFATPSTGFALDAIGTLLRTDNAGASWRILSPGEGRSQAVLALSSTRVLLAGPRGVLRSANGGDSFDRAIARAPVGRLDRAGSAVVAFGRRAAYVSSNAGRTWRAVRRPSRRTSIASLDFVSARVGFLVDDAGRLWRTGNAGRRWRELLTAGASPVGDLAFADARTGWLVVDHFRGDSAGWLLRTDDGGRSFRPQLVSPTPLLGDSTLAATGTRRGIAFSPGVAGPDDDYGGGSTVSGPQSFFATTTGGDRGREPRLTLGARRRGKHVRIAGRLAPADGGESILVSLRSGSVWRSVSARADSSGRFSLTRRIDRRTTVVAQWGGDDDRRGAGSRALTIR